MMQNFMRYFRAEALDNTGSLARDCLAAERTFLAWTRSGLGFIALGVALEKVEVLAMLAPSLLQLKDSKTKLAAGTLVGGGSLFVLHGTQRYFNTLTYLQAGKFKPNTGGVTMAAVATIAIAFAGAVSIVQHPEEERAM